MYLPAKFGGHRSYGNGYMNSYINSYRQTMEKVELTTSIHHIERFLKSRILIYNSEVSDTDGTKTKRRRRPRTTQVIAKCYAFHINAIG